MISEGVTIALIALFGVMLSPLALETYREWRTDRKERIRLEKEKQKRESEALATVAALQETVESLKSVNGELRTELDFARGRITHLEQMCFGGVRAQ